MQAKEGEIAFIATLVDPSYKLELATAVPSVGLVGRFCANYNECLNFFPLDL